MISAAALPMAACHGSVLIWARMKVTEDDRQPNAFSPAADFWTQTPALDKWERDAAITSRLTFSLCMRRRSVMELSHASCLAPFYLITLHSVSTFRSAKAKYLVWFLVKWSDSEPHLVDRLYSLRKWLLHDNFCLIILRLCSSITVRQSLHHSVLPGKKMTGKFS